MAIFSRVMFFMVDWAARRGLAPELPSSGIAAKQQAKQKGIRGETYAYWYLRRHGYVFVARNYTVAGLKGEIDLIGYDGPVLAFVEVKTRATEATNPVTSGKPPRRGCRHAREAPRHCANGAAIFVGAAHSRSGLPVRRSRHRSGGGPASHRPSSQGCVRRRIARKQFPSRIDAPARRVLR